jgi:hypothetical protein
MKERNQHNFGYKSLHGKIKTTKNNETTTHKTKKQQNRKGATKHNKKLGEHAVARGDWMRQQQKARRSVKMLEWRVGATEERIVTDRALRYSDLSTTKRPRMTCQ